MFLCIHFEGQSEWIAQRHDIEKNMKVFHELSVNKYLYT